jgi:aerotaxis receptor
MNKVSPIDEEFPFENATIISQTDTKGNITYANRAFCTISGYTRDELLNQPHNIIRHPDMPKTVFEKLWSTIKSGQAWNGLIKNLRKDGRYYWVDTEILPIKNDEGVITGFIAARRAASRKDIEENKEIYRKMLEAEK